MLSDSRFWLSPPPMEILRRRESPIFRASWRLKASPSQRLVAELHGAQRRRLGWSEELVARDFDQLRAAIIDEIRVAAPAAVSTRPVLDLLSRVLEQAKRSALQGWHSSAGLV